MCTVTVVSTRDNVSLACNRDEKHSRPAALLPQVRQFGRRRAVLPVDSVSGGTWVAVNDAGLAMALLNVNEQIAVKDLAAPSRSRGTIIPSLLSFDSWTRAVTRAAFLDATLYAPFRLLLADREQLAEVRADGTQVSVVSQLLPSEPLLFTSSGLGDHLVEEPRRRLFTNFFRGHADAVARQHQFHRHAWSESPHLSVCMSREDARTVSYTVVSLARDRATLTYHSDAPDQPAETISVHLDLTTGGA